MRLGLIVLLCLLNTGCALWRRDREEPVENGPREEKAEPVLKPSEALKPKSLEIASPVSDQFFMRGIYFQGDVTTLMRIDSTGATTPDGTLLSGEDDLGLDDVVDQGRMEFDIRMAERNHVRIDYFKLNRFSESQLPRDIDFGDFTFDAGDTFRTKLDWRMLSLTYTYSMFKIDRFEAGFGLGPAHLRSEGRRQRARHAQPRAGHRGRHLSHHRGERCIPHLQALGGDGARPVSYSASPDGFDGTLSDYHADIQYRWRKNFAVRSRLQQARDRSRRASMPTSHSCST